MPTYIKTLTDKDNNTILPKTRSTATYMENNETVENYLTNLKKETGPFVHENLLDNWNFSQPINQLERKQYQAKGTSVDVSVPIIDRWRLYAYKNTTVTVDLVSDALRLSASSTNEAGIFSYLYSGVFSKISGKTVTFSAYIPYTEERNSNVWAEIKTVNVDGSYSLPISSPKKLINSSGYFTWTFVAPNFNQNQNSSFSIALWTDNIVYIQNVKLELGSESTIRNSQKDFFDPSQELLKCRQYRRVLKGSNDDDFIAPLFPCFFAGPRGIQNFILEVKGPFRKLAFDSRIHVFGPGTFEAHSPATMRWPLEKKACMFRNTREGIYLYLTMRSDQNNVPVGDSIYQCNLKNRGGEAGILIDLDDGVEKPY